MHHIFISLALGDYTQTLDFQIKVVENGKALGITYMNFQNQAVVILSRHWHQVSRDKSAFCSKAKLGKDSQERLDVGTRIYGGVCTCM